MKTRILLSVLLLWLPCVSLHAQMPSQPLTPEEILLDQQRLLEEEAPYLAGRKTGKGLTIAGGALAAVGAGVTIGTGLVYVVGLIFVAPLSAASQDSQSVVDNYSSSFKPWLYGGLAGVGVGAGLLAAGIPILVTNNRKLSEIRNKEQAVELAFGPTACGTGFVLRF